MKNELAKAAFILRKVKQPNIPNEVATLQEESLKDEPDVIVIANCISRNPKLLTKFLGIATYVSKGEVRNAKEAVEMLGTQNVFNLFFSSAIEFSLHDTGQNSMIVNYAIKIAVAMSELARNIDHIHSGDAYLYGILSNVGTVVLNRYDHRYFKNIYLPSFTSPKQAVEKELEWYGTASHYIGVYVAKKWHVKNAIYSGILFQDRQIPKCDKGVNLAYEMINLMHIARYTIAETENERFVSDEVRSNALSSMECLGLGNKAFFNAQRKVKNFTQDIQIVPDDFLDDDEESNQTPTLHENKPA